MGMIGFKMLMGVAALVVVSTAFSPTDSDVTMATAVVGTWEMMYDNPNDGYETYTTLADGSFTGEGDGPWGCDEGFTYCSSSTSPGRTDLHEHATSGQTFCDLDSDCIGDVWCVNSAYRDANTCVRPSRGAYTYYGGYTDHRCSASGANGTDLVMGGWWVMTY